MVPTHPGRAGASHLQVLPQGKRGVHLYLRTSELRIKGVQVTHGVKESLPTELAEVAWSQEQQATDLD